jgi:carboxymethylenebutenolidase
MWNQFKTEGYDGMVAEIIALKGYNGDYINAYFARPIGEGGAMGSVVLVHHLPGWDEFYRETTRRFAQQGYATICPNLYHRFGEGTPDDAAAAARAQGGVSDASVIGDCEAARDFLKALPYTNGKVGIVGTCSGGRHAYLVACSTSGFDAVADLWGGGVVQPETTPQRPVAPIDLTKNLQCPVLGLFGNEDQNPSPEAVNQLEEELKKQGKKYDFHRYDGAGHGFFYYDRPNYRQQQAMDGWAKLLAFFAENLQGAPVAAAAR